MFEVEDVMKSRGRSVDLVAHGLELTGGVGHRLRAQKEERGVLDALWLNGVPAAPKQTVDLTSTPRQLINQNRVH